MLWDIPEAAVSPVDVELTNGNGGVLVVIESGPADVVVAPGDDAVAHVEMLELVRGNGGKTLVAEAEAVSFRGAEEVVGRELVETVTSGTDNVALLDAALRVECLPVPLGRVPEGNEAAEVELARGNGAEVGLGLSTLLVREVDLLVVVTSEVLTVSDTEDAVCALGLTMYVVVLRDMV